MAALEDVQRRGAWRVVSAALLAAVLVCGVATVARFHVWAEIDEAQHYAYVQELAEHGRLPRVDDLVSAQVRAISEHTWPRPAAVGAARAGLEGVDYEAWQPPLYYVSAVPAFLVGGDHRDKVFALRAFDLALLLVACALLWRLARRELPEAPSAAFAGGLGVLLWPGVLVRGVTVSNLPLEIVVATGALLVLHRAWTGRDGRALVLGGAVVGVGLLTKLSLTYLLVPLALVAWSLRRVAPRAAVAALLAPGVVVAPWLVSNLVRFGALTANGASMDVVEPYLYPGGSRPGLDALPDRLWGLTHGVLPQEWEGQLDVPWVRAATLLLFAALLAATVAAAVRGRSPLAYLTLAGLAGYLMAFGWGQVVDRWDVLMIRYAYPLLPAVGVAAGAWLWRRAGDRVALVATAAGAVALAALWVDMAGRFYFVDIGARLGI